MKFKANLLFSFFLLTVLFERDLDSKIGIGFLNIFFNQATVAPRVLEVQKITSHFIF